MASIDGGVDNLVALIKIRRGMTRRDRALGRQPQPHAAHDGQ
jgi:hypothetical protein